MKILLFLFVAFNLYATEIIYPNNKDEINLKLVTNKIGEYSIKIIKEEEPIDKYNLDIVFGSLSEIFKVTYENEQFTKTKVFIPFENSCYVEFELTPDNLNLKTMRLNRKKFELNCQNEISNIHLIGPDKKSGLPFIFNSELLNFELKIGKITGIKIK